MHTYLQSEKGMYIDGRYSPPLYTVGHYDPSGKWIAESDHKDEEAAANRAAFLNGSHLPPGIVKELVAVAEMALDSAVDTVTLDAARAVLAKLEPPC